MAHILIGVIIGMFIGRFFRLPRECARVIRGYNCQGLLCDHSDKAYYQAKYYEALDKDT
jgi:hypothetical protein